MRTSIETPTVALCTTLSVCAARAALMRRRDGCGCSGKLESLPVAVGEVLVGATLWLSISRATTSGRQHAQRPARLTTDAECLWTATVTVRRFACPDDAHEWPIPKARVACMSESCPHCHADDDGAMTEGTKFDRIIQLCSGRDAAQALDPVLWELRELLQVRA